MSSVYMEKLLTFVRLFIFLFFLFGLVPILPPLLPPARLLCFAFECIRCVKKAVQRFDFANEEKPATERRKDEYDEEIKNGPAYLLNRRWPSEGDGRRRNETDAGDERWQNAHKERIRKILKRER